MVFASGFSSALALSSPIALCIGGPQCFFCFLLFCFLMKLEAWRSMKLHVGGAGYGRGGAGEKSLGKAEESSWERPGGQ